jgi:hypothetical protein
MKLALVDENGSVTVLLDNAEELDFFDDSTYRAFRRVFEKKISKASKKSSQKTTTVEQVLTAPTNIEQTRQRLVNLCDLEEEKEYYRTLNPEGIQEMAEWLLESNLEEEIEEDRKAESLKNSKQLQAKKKEKKFGIF